MKEERKWRDEIDAAFGKTPDMFHRRIEQTLRSLQAEQKEEPVVKRKVNGGIALLVALLMISAIGVAAKFTGYWTMRAQWCGQTGRASGSGHAKRA